MAASADAAVLLQEVDVAELVDRELHSFVDDLQVAIGEVHSAIERAWFASLTTATAAARV